MKVVRTLSVVCEVCGKLFTYIVKTRHRKICDNPACAREKHKIAVIKFLARRNNASQNSQTFGL